MTAAQDRAAEALAIIERQADNVLAALDILASKAERRLVMIGALSMAITKTHPLLTAALADEEEER